MNSMDKVNTCCSLIGHYSTRPSTQSPYHYLDRSGPRRPPNSLRVWYFRLASTNDDSIIEIIESARPRTDKAACRKKKKRLVNRKGDSPFPDWATTFSRPRSPRWTLQLWPRAGNRRRWSVVDPLYHMSGASSWSILWRPWVWLRSSLLGALWSEIRRFFKFFDFYRCIEGIWSLIVMLQLIKKF